MSAKNLYERAVSGVKDYFETNHLTTAVIGLSGGIDSALTAAIAVDALGAENVKGVYLPTRYSSDDSLEGVKGLKDTMGIDVQIHEIQDTYQMMKSMTRAEGIADENLQARIRGTIIMTVANTMPSATVLNTCNKSEDMVGYFTLYGDSVGSLAPLGDVFKTQVYEMAHWRNSVSEVIPSITLTRAPSAELSFDQKDTDSLPEYETLDKILEGMENNEDDVLMGERFGSEYGRVKNLYERSAWKRLQVPPAVSMSHHKEER